MTRASWQTRIDLRPESHRLKVLRSTFERTERSLMLISRRASSCSVVCVMMSLMCLLCRTCGAKLLRACHAGTNCCF